MKTSIKALLLISFTVASLASAASGQVFINEIAFNPPGNPDGPNEYIELRGTPSSVLSLGTYLLSIEGDATAVQTTGAVRDIFDLSSQSFGSNGFLTLLQNGSLYSTDPAANTLTNSVGTGYGNAIEGSTVGHTADDDATDIRNASITYMLIQSAVAPGQADDVDGDNERDAGRRFLGVDGV